MRLSMTEWSIHKARELYHIAHWGDGFFDINEQGQVQVFPNNKREASPHIDLCELVQRLTETNINFPVLLRFTDILRKRIQFLNDAFNEAIQQFQYKGHYLSAY